MFSNKISWAAILSQTNIRRSSSFLTLFAFFFGCALTGLAQRTEVKDVGAGMKMEFDYNAANQVTETRTVGADGKILQKVEYEYQSGFVGPQQTTINYWPDGKTPRDLTRVTYDEDSNFTGEFAKAFDDSGKAILGHEIRHDPMTNTYTCTIWNAAQQKFLPQQCPGGEAPQGGAEGVKKFTREEIVQHLDAARKPAPQDERAARLRKLMAAPAGTSGQREVALVLPAQVLPGERISGIIAEDPAIYEGLAEVTVTKLAVPFESGGEAESLHGWLFEAPGEKQQRADGPITFVVPRGTASVTVVLRQGGNPAHFVSQTLHFSPATSESPARSFKAPPLCLKGHLCMVEGPFSGDSNKTFAAFDDHAATIVAETSHAAFVSIPESARRGPHPLFLAEGSKVVGFPITIGYFRIGNSDRSLEKGQTLITFPIILDGPGDIAEPLWRVGNFPPTNLAEARKLLPGFQLPDGGSHEREKREAKEKGAQKEKREAEEKKDGLILVIVKNATPDQISIRGSKDQMMVFRLSDGSFSRGLFQYDLLAESLKSGPFKLECVVLPFLAPVAGQEFIVPASQAGKQ